MSEHDDVPGSFLRRWSQRKRAAETQVREERRPSPETGGSETSASPVSVEPGMAASPAFDPTHLPPIESITAASDVRAFLAPGVPVELSRAALRRAWMTDPAIRDFIGLAENQWDFTKPDAVPGFGPLELTPQVRRIIREFVTGAANETAPGSDLDSRRVAPAPQKSHEEASLAADQTADTGADRIVVPADEGKSRAELVPPVVVRCNDDAAMQRDSEEASGDRPLTQRRHGSALPK